MEKLREDNRIPTQIDKERAIWEMFGHNDKEINKVREDKRNTKR